MGRIIKLFLLGVISYLLFVNMVYADTPCQPIYGGGQTCTSPTKITPDKKKIAPTPSVTKGGYQTVLPKGGFPVLSPVPVYATPATGAQALILFSLIPIGISGWLLRKHTIKNGKGKNLTKNN